MAKDECTKEKHNILKGKVVIGLTQKITIISPSEIKRTVTSKIDTGADKSSIDSKLAGQLKLGPVLKTTTVKSAHGKTLRPVIKAHIRIAGKKVDSEFTLADRGHMKYKVLIGRNTLRKGFLIDPSRN